MGQPLRRGAALNYTGRLTVLVHGRPYGEDPGSLMLVNLSNIVLELGKPPSVAPPASYDFSSMRR